MAALTVTSTQVLPTSDTQSVFGIAGASITAGQAVYLDDTTTPSAPVWKLFDADLVAANTKEPAVSLTTAASGQPIVVATGGSITMGAGAAPTLGVIYLASATAGDIAPSTDLASNWRTTIIGVGGATNTIRLRPWNSGKTKA